MSITTERTRRTADRRGIGLPLPAVGRSPVHEAVTRFAQTTPSATAVCGGGHTLTYAELDRRAAAVAAQLAAAGIGKGDRVGLRAEPSPVAIAAVVGILRAGAAYVPVDPTWPGARVTTVLDDAGVCVVVATEGLAIDGRTTIHAEHAQDTVAPVPAAASDAAYLIYTSGSTGEPKGVQVTHGQLAASTLARRLVYPDRPVFLLVSPLAFDSSVAGIWGTLTTGGTLVVASRDEVRDPEALARMIGRHSVTQTLCVPSLYAVILDAAHRAGPGALATLHTVVVAGEPLPDALVERHFAELGDRVALVNEYGPTEATVWASYRRFTRPGPVSIGGPVPGTRLYVLDDAGNPVPDGAEGELVIGGEGVTDGYFGRPEATAEVFEPDPDAGRPGARRYRTGDRVRWNPDGTLAFLGRRDHQVKIRGNRVELGAVESAAREVPGVRDAVVVPDGSRTALVGFVLADPGTGAEDVRAELGRRLPAAHVPARVRILEHFPLTFSGKVDRNQLTAAADEEPGTTTEGGATTADVAAAWSEVLKVPEVPDDANFFELGGHSLAMFQLQEALERRTGVRPSVVALFQHTTVTAQARLISGGGSRGPGREADRSQLVSRRAQAVRARRERAARKTGRSDG